jgi:hypothetical protein
VTFSLRISKLVAFTLEKTKQKNLFFLKTKNMLEKKHGTQCGIYFFLLFAGVFVFFVFGLYKTKQLKS